MPPRQGSDRGRVAIVVPRHRAALTPDERISLAHLEHHLGGHPRFFIVPETLRVVRPGFDVVRFPDRHFADVAAFSALQLTEGFYRAFRGFDFILTYQLDCLVLSDDLSAWCDSGWDYVGAPWLRTPGQAFEYAGPERCGNGGFSLRNVARSIHAIRSARPVHRRVRRTIASWLPQDGPAPEIAPLHDPAEASRYLVDEFPWNEDLFWSFGAQAWDPAFRVAPPEVALRFAFECDPRACFERNAGKLPFGCHAWARYDRAFWEDYLLAPVAD